MSADDVGGPATAREELSETPSAIPPGTPSGTPSEASAAASPDAETPGRRVVEPDLLWIESVTERLLGSAGRPASWERVYFEGDEPEAADPGHEIGQQAGDESGQQSGRQSGRQSGVSPGGAFAARGYVAPATVAATETPTETPTEVPTQAPTAPEPLPERTPADYQEPVSYGQVVSDRAAAAEPEPAPTPYFDPPAARPSPAAPSAARRSASEDMPPAVLRAALRDALPDDLTRRPRPVDAVFGDPSWQLPPEPDEPEDDDGDHRREWEAAAPVAEPAAPPRPVKATGRHAAPAPAPQPEPEPEPQQESQPEPEAEPEQTSQQPEPEPAPAPAAPAAPATPRDPGEQALRLAFRSGDEELAAAVVALVTEQGRDRQRVRTVEAYLDALLAEVGDTLPGAARLRRLLGD